MNHGEPKRPGSPFHPAGIQVAARRCIEGGRCSGPDAGKKPGQSGGQNQKIFNAPPITRDAPVARHAAVAALTRRRRIGHNLGTGNPNLASASLLAGIERWAQMASLIPRTCMGTERLNENGCSRRGQSARTGRNLLFHYFLCLNDADALPDSGEELDNPPSNRHSHPSQITLNLFN